MMLKKSKATAKSEIKNRCLSCGTVQNKKGRRYCSIKCRQNLRQKLNTRSGLLQALNTRYATFYFSDEMIYMDVVPYGIKEIFRYTSLRSVGSIPADDFSTMTNMLGMAWWEEEKRTAKKYLASRHVLDLATRCVISPSLMRPRVIKVPTVKTEVINFLEIDKADLHSSHLSKIIKDAYRRLAKTYHPDRGGDAKAFRKLHAAYTELLHWADSPKFIRRRGFCDKWYYDGESGKWIQPVPVHN